MPLDPLEVAFEEWWKAEGKYIDPDSEVSWFDKRKELSFESYRAGRQFVGADGL